MSTTDKYMEVVFADDTNPNAIKKPAKAWRNWWKTMAPFTCAPSRREFDVGAVFVGHRGPFPSKDIAEQKAADIVAENKRRYGGQFCKYLGAFPEGERP